MPSQRKIDIVEKLKDKVGRAKSMVFTNYQGLTHKQLEELKKVMKSVDADFVTTKNTLLAKAMEDGKWKMENPLEGPTATLFAYSDVIAPLKEIAKSIRLLKLPTIKFGILERKEVSADDIMRLATVPSREVLIAQVVLGMKAPIYGLHRALNWNIQKLVLTLKSIENSKK